MSRHRLAVGMLATCCMLWGISFPLMQFITDRLSHLGDPASVSADLAMRATFIGWRFLAAALLYGVFTLRHQRDYTPADFSGGMLVGLFFTAGLFCQVTGLRYALPSISSVLTSLVVLFTPLAEAVLLRRRVSAVTWRSVAVALCGVVILSMPNPRAAAEATLIVAPPVPWLGEGITLLGSMLFTGQVLVIDRFGGRAHPARFTLVSFVTTAALGLGLGAVLGGSHLYGAPAVTELAGDARWMLSIAAVVLLSSVAAFHLMNTWQPLVAPAAATVVYCLEPVFATAWSIVFRTESLTLVTLGGGALVIGAILLLTRGGGPAAQPAA
jgi:drug/metabolite transporter (DMT)-like permease